VKDLRAEAAALEVAADLTLENRLLKKCMTGLGATANEDSRRDDLAGIEPEHVGRTWGQPGRRAAAAPQSSTGALTAW
jgi:hypothetical protein